MLIQNCRNYFRNGRCNGDWAVIWEVWTLSALRNGLYKRIFPGFWETLCFENFKTFQNPRVWDTVISLFKSYPNHIQVFGHDIPSANMVLLRCSRFFVSDVFFFPQLVHHNANFQVIWNVCSYYFSRNFLYSVEKCYGSIFVGFLQILAIGK